MMYRLLLLLTSCFFCAGAFAQAVIPATSCGQQGVMQHLYALHPEYKAIQEQAEKILAARNHAIASGSLRAERNSSILTLPVVVHIIHNNGAENISDAQVFQGIQHLNEAYANNGYYDPTDGVNTQIQFCMAQRDPANNPTNGITRDVSANTVMGGPDYYSDDQAIKDLNRWNPLCYINIWLVKSIPTSVVGYAYLPSAHGSNLDGIIIEASYFGSSYSNDVVVAHEMGHYLGLYHTFQGGCTNNDCTSDGDHVCDTPPDQSTAGISCTSSANSCSTDILSGFATDQHDLTQDYMDYGNFNCMKVFTQGQADRMNWFIQNIRNSLLACKSCMAPCPAPVLSGFTNMASPFIAGNPYTFINTSVNAASYEWWVNGIQQSSMVNFTYVFPAAGSYTIKLIARSGNALCDDAVKTVTINAVCGVMAGFSKSAATAAAGNAINFSNTSAGTSSYQWLVNGVLQSTALNFSYTSTVAGDDAITLLATQTATGCQQSYTDTVHYTCSVTTDFTASTTATLVNTAVNFTSTGTGETTYQWLVNGVAAGMANTLTYTFTTVGAYTIQLVTGNGVCSAAKSTVVYVNDKCGRAQYQFQKSYAAGTNSRVQAIRQTADGGSIQTQAFIDNGNTTFDAALLKTDVAGNVQWMKKYSSNSGSAFYKTKPTADKGYISIGHNGTPGVGTGKIYLVKTDPAGNITWSTELAIPFALASGTDILQATDGSYYFTGGATYSPTAITRDDDVVAGKLDAVGNLIWLNHYDQRGSETPTALAEDNNQLIICGNSTATNGASGFLLKLNKTDGSIVWSKTYKSADENWLGVLISAKGYLVDGRRRQDAGGIYTDHVFLGTDFNGNISYSKYIQPFGTVKETGWAGSVLNSKGNLFSFTTGIFGGIYYDFIVQELNLNTGILWTKKYNRPLTWITSLDNAGSGIYLGGFSIETTAPPLQSDIMQLDSAGNAGNCVAQPTDIQLLPAQYSSNAGSFAAKAIQPQVTSITVATPVSVNSNTFCLYVKCDSAFLPVDTCKLCDTIQLSGADTVCSLINPVTYQLQRSPGCTAVPNWYLSDSGKGTIAVINDSTITVTPSGNGPLTLYATLHTGCRTLRDSLHLSVLHSRGSIQLGPDIMLCSFSTLQLNAGAGFVSYRWNDGSVDSMLTAYNPGRYFVTATDYCGNQFSDSILLSQAPAIPFDLGPDLQKCTGDTLSATAPGNFISYTWSPDYNISSNHDATVRLWPVADTTYTVVALVASGCTVVDTLRVLVKQAPAIHIGKDTSFCAGDSLVLTAPKGFTGYAWQDGSTGPGYTATQAGLYYLQATAANGCIARDTVTVKNIYPLPAGFLDPEASTCPGKQVVLNALGNWPAYHWFDNSNSSFVTVSMPGKYWLQVTNSNGCMATDTLVVAVAAGCTTGIHFPNAFTPDHNGNNDTYKPVVYGLPLAFRLAVYNRFGEKVFETTDYTKGWDGMYKGTRQPPGGFVWYCAYQFNGSPAKTEKGALLLIR